MADIVGKNGINSYSLFVKAQAPEDGPVRRVKVQKQPCFLSEYR
jgi:hypothetical protein